MSNGRRAPESRPRYDSTENVPVGTGSERIDSKFNSSDLTQGIAKLNAFLSSKANGRQPSENIYQQIYDQAVSLKEKSENIPLDEHGKPIEQNYARSEE